MKTIVIPDVHNRVDWIEPFLTGLEYDEVVFLGDYFDQFHDGPFEAGKTAYWLKSSLAKPNRVHLIGNHDMPYLLYRSVQEQWCPGWDKDKDKRINSIITREEWNKLRPAYIAQGWLLSHAGFSAPVFAKPIGETVATDLVERVNKSLELLKGGIPQPDFAPGYRMGVDGNLGGVTWAHWQNEFQPIVGINQIVGHTIADFIRVKKFEKSLNYCIDSNNRIALQITDGKLGAIKTPLVNGTKDANDNPS